MPPLVNSLITYQVRLVNDAVGLINACYMQSQFRTETKNVKNFGNLPIWHVKTFKYWFKTTDANGNTVMYLVDNCWYKHIHWRQTWNDCVSYIYSFNAVYNCTDKMPSKLGSCFQQSLRLTLKVKPLYKSCQYGTSHSNHMASSPQHKSNIKFNTM